MFKDMLYSVFVLPILVLLYVADVGFSGKRFVVVTLPTLVISAAASVTVGTLLGSVWMAIGASTFVAYSAMLGLYRFDEAERVR